MPSFGLRSLLIATAIVSAYLATLVAAKDGNQLAAAIAAVAYSCLVIYLVYRLGFKK